MCQSIKTVNKDSAQLLKTKVLITLL